MLKVLKCVGDDGLLGRADLLLAWRHFAIGDSLQQQRVFWIAQGERRSRVAAPNDEAAQTQVKVALLRTLFTVALEAMGFEDWPHMLFVGDLLGSSLLGEKENQQQKGSKSVHIDAMGGVWGGAFIVAQVVWWQR